MSTDIFYVKEHVVPCQHIREYPGALRDHQEDVLQLHVKQYIPIDQPNPPFGALTIIGAHANGFPKELYEPLWEDLYQRCRSTGIAIRGFWTTDIAQEGQSFVLNEDRVGNDPSWFDHSRDLLHMVNCLRDQMPRPIFGLGHSLGGCQLTNLSLMHPRLFSSLILLDPIIQEPHPLRTGSADSFRVARASTFRRDLWPSRGDAAASFRKSNFYQAWDPRVLERWLKYGLRDLPTALYPQVQEESSKETPVTLTTSKHQEVFTFLRPNFDGRDSDGKPVVNRVTHPDVNIAEKYHYPFYRPESGRTLQNLPFVRPSVLYVFGEHSEMQPPELRRAKMEATGIGVGGSGGAKEGRVREVILGGVGHLIAMDAPSHCADAVVPWIDQEMRRWREGEEEWKRDWNAKSRAGKTTVSEEWKRRIGGNPRDVKSNSSSKI